MVERRYYCDMCRDSHKADSKNLVGLHFTSSAISREVGGITSTERHICLSCLKSLSIIYQHQTDVFKK